MKRCLVVAAALLWSAPAAALRSSADSSSTWSPGGRQLALVQGSRGWELTVVGSDSTGLRVLRRIRGGFSVPHWRPHH